MVEAARFRDDSQREGARSPSAVRGLRSNNTVCRSRSNNIVHRQSPIVHILLLTFLAGTASAQGIIERLVDEGFENVRMGSNGNEVVVAYENRVYRYEIQGLREVMEHVMPLANGFEKVTFVPLSRGVPLVSVTVPANQKFEEKGVSDMEVSSDPGAAWRVVRGEPSANRSFGRFDMVVHPGLNVRFGNYGNTVESQISLVPELTTTLWRGMSVSAQVILPVQNDFRGGDTGIRPGILAVNQTVRLTGSAFVSATAGYFTQHRYGLDVTGSVFLAGGRAGLHASAGRTGYASFDHGTWLYAEPDTWTYTAGGSLYVPRYNLILGAAYGRYIYGDRGLRVDVTREFGEIRVGFFASRTDNVDNAGFCLSGPLFGRRYFRPSRLRIRPARSFQWQYRYRGLVDDNLMYDTGYSPPSFRKALTPAFIRNLTITL